MGPSHLFWRVTSRLGTHTHRDRQGGRTILGEGYGGKLQDYVIILLLHQMVVLCNRIEDSHKYCVCVLLRIDLWEITLTGDLRCLLGGKT
jgi:hypothetical protein